MTIIGHNTMLKKNYSKKKTNIIIKNIYNAIILYIIRIDIL